MRIAILVLAAGFSRRFRESGGEHKLLASLNGKPVLQHTLEHAAATGLDLFVVTRPEETEIAALINAGRSVICNSQGIGDSIAAGVKASADYDGWLITLGDMPFLTVESLLAVADALRHAPLVRAEVNGEPGHPVGFQRPFYPALIALSGDTGARALLQCAPCQAVKLADKGCVLDIDTRSDLQRFLRAP
ncbi:nucleotidyltransferase family protein [Pantoea piersonii]|uniref:nucleotidyltransferase family protein n=1 Tax=Pantoea piersonii TaxID=2364647 RepID=UPI0028A001CC|nr:nucleotidyltransferase family protein [Pantoea piersonii]